MMLNACMRVGMALVMVLVVGCVAGSAGYSTNRVVGDVELGRPVRVELQVHSRRYLGLKPSRSAFRCMFRLSDEETFRGVPLVYEGRMSGADGYTCCLPALEAPQQALEYYFEYQVQGHTNRTDLRVLSGDGVLQTRPLEAQEWSERVTAPEPGQGGAVSVQPGIP